MWAVAISTVVQVYRGYAVDLALHVGTLALIVVDAPRWRGPETPVAPQRAPLGLMVSAALVAGLFGWLGGSLPRDSGWLDATLAVPGLIALWVVLRPVRAHAVPWSGGDSAPSHWLVWPLLGVALGVIELLNFAKQQDPTVADIDYPTLSTTLDPLFAHAPVRGVYLAAWLLVGWWLVRRIAAWQGRS